MAILGYSKGEVLRYVFLPQILPRIREVFGTGFFYLAYFVAQVFRAGNLLPASHPYLSATHTGAYGLRDVITEASRNLTYDRKHIDQFIFFASVLVGMVMLAIQCVLLLLSLVISPARAQGAGAQIPSNYMDFLITKNHETDLAFRLLDRVFGVPDLFKSSDMVGENESAFHTALHGLFQFYSLGLLVIAVLILAYFIAAIVAETAETGTPFGKRYNHVWAPVRLVVALGLLIPMGYGLNAAQWITLYAAKFGSGFATNGWITFSQELGVQYKSLIASDPNKVADAGEDSDARHLVHIPNRPDIRTFVAFMYTVKSCQWAVKTQHPNYEVKAYLVKNSAEVAGSPDLSVYTYNAARAFFNNTNNMRIRFGELDPKNHKEEMGHIYPFCGEIMLPTSDTDKKGARHLNEFYYDLIRDLWAGDKYKINEYAENEMQCTTSKRSERDKCDEKEPPNNFATDIMTSINKELDEAIEQAVEDQVDEFMSNTYGEGSEKGALQELEEFGWGGAGIYYNTVATMNGAITAGVSNAPYPLGLPAAMRNVEEEKRQQDKSGQGGGAKQSGTRSNQWEDAGDEHVYAAINRANTYWQKRIVSNRTENIIIDLINWLLGTNALFDMCKNAEVHPLAQLAGVGRALIETASRNLVLSITFGLGSALISGPIGAISGAASSFFVTFAMISLMMGFLMYYVIPFMPFLYFFFAVTGWVKGIFEAMVGVPLWALAHLRIDGQGLPGDAATQGYYLILEIFLRPILIIFGLLAALSIFAAMVRVLNETFYLVVSNVGGFDKEGIDLCGTKAEGGGPAVGTADWFRGPVDQFFFTIVYAIVVYLIGTSCFKMIDAVPNKILRWMGTQVNSFGDTQSDAGEGLLMKLSVGGHMATSQLQGAFGNMGGFLRTSTGAGDKGLAPLLQREAEKAMAKSSGTTTTPKTPPGE